MTHFTTYKHGYQVNYSTTDRKLRDGYYIM